MDRVNSVQELIERTQGMPLERMRFFINEDRREPKCFGIYYDAGLDRWIVYKNKADGSRAVRYSGPDEAYAANELWMKLQSEINLRRGHVGGGQRPPLSRGQAILRGLGIAFTVLMVLFVLWQFVSDFLGPHRGYYRVDDGLYYYQDDYWYWYDDGDWTYYDAPAGDWYGDGYCGEYYQGLPRGEAFEDSGYYVEPSRDSDSQVFDSWDSGDTDWSSDW